MKLKLAPVFPRNETKQRFFELYDLSSLLVVYGAPGTGKTFLATSLALKSYAACDADINRIVLVRPNVPVGPSLGSFPGESDDKVANWVGPLMDCIQEHCGKAATLGMIKTGQIKLQPLETIRGASYENSIIIVDEAQNLTWEQIKAVSTRIGENSKMLLLGDPSQSDINISCNPLERFAQLCKRYNVPQTSVIRFSDDDVVRSPIVKSLVKAFKLEGSNAPK